MTWGFISQWQQNILDCYKKIIGDWESTIIMKLTESLNASK